MEAISKSDIKSIIKSDVRFDISIKRTTWIDQKFYNWEYFFSLWTRPKSNAIRAIWKKGLAWLEGIVGLAQPGLWLLWVAEGSEEQRGLGCPWGFLQTCHCTWDTVGLVSLDSIFSLTPQGSSGLKIIIILSIRYKCSGWDIYGINKRRKRTSIFPVGCAHCSAHWSSKQYRAILV